jgi:Na+:H+ antiporter, NhaC family
VTSVLVPWNTCGAYISGVLGVPTASYLPFCFFNLLSPVLDVLFGFIGFKVPTATPVAAAVDEPASDDAGQRASQ